MAGVLAGWSIPIDSVQAMCLGVEVKKAENSAAADLKGTAELVGLDIIRW
jgi:hypothetical protein